MYHIRVQKLFQFRVWFVHLYMYICICRLLYICWPFSYICFFFIHRSFTPFRYSAFWTKYTIAPATANTKKNHMFFSLSRMWLKTEKKHVKVTLAQIYNVTKATINTNTRLYSYEFYALVFSTFMLFLVENRCLTLCTLWRLYKCIF